MSRPSEALPMSFFHAPRPGAGPRVVLLALGEVRVELAEIDDALAETLLRRYAAHATAERAAGDALRVRLGREDIDYFLRPPPTPEINPVILTCEGERVRYLGHRAAGWFDTLAGRGELLLARGEYEPADRAVENYLRAAVAWQAASRGGALVHAASAVWDGRGYLFYGASGAGKSTLAACNTRAAIVSDDLSLVLPGRGGRLDLVGSPFRGTYEGGEPVRGRFPLAAGFRLVKDVAARVERVPRARALAELVGNLPFVAEAFGSRPDLFERVHDAFVGIELAHLHFRKDDSYWDAVREAGL